MAHHRKSRPYALTALIIYTAMIFGLCGGAAQASPAPVQASGGQRDMFRISGQVTNGPAEGNVRAIRAGGVVAGETSIREEGKFTFPPLPVNAYTLQVLDPQGQPLSLGLESRVTVYPEEKTLPRFHVLTVQSLPMQTEAAYIPAASADATGQISGMVTAEDSGLPLSDIFIQVVDENHNYLAQSVNTDINGAYRITGLATGQYKLYFHSYSGGNTIYAPEWYDGQQDWQHATPVSVTNGETRYGINVTLDIGGKISGIVTALDGGAPLENAYVFIYTDPSGPICGSYSSENRTTPPCNELAFDYTDSNGMYTISGLPVGNYYLHFSRTEYLPLFYDNRATPLGADPVHVTLGNTSGNVNGALTLGGVIAGRVTNADGGVPMAGVSVYAYETNISYEGWTDYVNYAGYALTDSAGVYSVRGLTGGNYYLKFFKADYLPSYYNGHAKLLDAEPVGVEAARTTQNIDASLTLGGKISGHASASVGGAPISGASVYLYDSRSAYIDDYVAHSLTDAAGDYTVAGLDNGIYYVRFEGWKYRQVYFNNKFTLSMSDGVPVTRGTTATGINASLDAKGKISGMVTDASTGLPIEGVIVHAYGQPDAPYDKNAVTTDINGMYTIEGLSPGNYSIGFRKSGYLVSFYSIKSSLAEADVIEITYNSAFEHADTAMSMGGTIMGQVTAADGGEPLEGVAVLAYASRTSDTYAALGNTDDSGIYTLTGLEPGDYYLFFTRPGYEASVYHNRASLEEADPVAVSLGQVTGNINEALGPGGRIRGRVTSAVDGSPLAGIAVYTYNTSGDLPAYSDWSYTDSGGNYTISGLAAGEYSVFFTPPAESDYIPQYYNHDAAGEKAQPVSVGPNFLVDHIDAALAIGGRISGQVTGKDGIPLADVQVSVTYFSTFCGEPQVSYTAGATTDNTGHYVVRQLPTGAYQVGFWPYWSSSLYLGEYYNDQSNLDQADNISVTAGETTGAIDAVLSQGGAVTGTVTAADTGVPLGATIFFYNILGPVRMYVDKFEGAFVMMGLEPGSYKVYFSPWNSYYAPEYYSDKNSLVLADTINIAAGGVVGGVNASLSQGGHFTGHVTAAEDGDPLVAVEVDVYDGEGKNVGAGLSDETGAYTTSALSTGNYRLEFHPLNYYSGDYLSKYYSNEATLETADSVALIAPADTVANAALDLGGAISGHVKDAQTGLPLSGFKVVILDRDKNEIRTEYSDQNGYYRGKGLPTGTYYVNFYLPGVCPARIFDLYYNQKPDLASANPLNIVAPGLRAFVDAFITQNYLFLPSIGR